MNQAKKLEWALALLAVMVCLPALCSARPAHRVVNPEWRATAASMLRNTSQEVPVRCPPGGHLYMVWGNNPYTSDSSICSAAVHAGLITVKQGGLVYVKVKSVEESYTGNYRNGVTSQGYTTRYGSFTFPRLQQNLPAQKRPPPRPEDTTWSTTASKLNDQPGHAFKFICPSGGEARKVWGNNPYTSDSSICSAALHAGLVTAADGGAVQIKMVPGQDAYTGNYRNGLTSGSYGKWGSSYIFPRATRDLPAQTKPPPDPGAVTWDSSASRYRGVMDQAFELNCPASGRVGTVWGNNPYTDDSSICSAAVHAGLITTRGGGTVHIRMAPGQQAYTGATRNGVTSQTYGTWGSSFIFPQAALDPSARVQAEVEP